MKSYNGLFADMVELEEIKSSILEAAREKTGRPEVKRALADTDGKAQELQEKFIKEEWYPPKHAKSRLCEGSHKKTRMIVKPRWDDEQIVHHVLMRQFRKIVEPRLYRYACGSLKGRGPHFAKRTIKRWRDGYKGARFYVAELDIKGFYDNVDTEILKSMIRKRVRDKRYLTVLFRVIDGGAPGLPKGFYTSPWFSHFMLTPLDNYITQTLRPDHYLRYADNMFLFSKNKKKLHQMVREVSRYLWEKLHLRLKEDWQVFRFESMNRRTGKVTGRAVNCLGFVIHRDRVTMRKSILERARAKANRIKQSGHMRRIDAAAIISYMGWFKHTDTYGYYLRWIKPKVSVRYCKRRLAAYARKKKTKGAKNNDGLEKGPGQQDGGARRAGYNVERDHRLRAPEYPAGNADPRDGRPDGGDHGVGL